MWSRVLFILYLIFLQTEAQFDFEPPCSCEGSYCECCVNAFVIDQEGKFYLFIYNCPIVYIIIIIKIHYRMIFCITGCLRLTLNDNSVRISFVLNGQDLGGFSIQTSGPIRSKSVTIRIPCLPGASLSLIVRNERTTSSGRRFCLNVLARTLFRTLYDNNFCFDVNGNSLQSVING